MPRLMKKQSSIRASFVVESLWTPTYTPKVRDSADDWFEEHCKRWVALFVLFVGVPLTGVGGLVLQGWIGTYVEGAAADCSGALSVEATLFRPDHTPAPAMIIFPLYMDFGVACFQCAIIALPFLVTPRDCHASPPLWVATLVLVALPLMASLTGLVGGFLEERPHRVITVLDFFIYKWGFIGAVLWLSRRQHRVVSRVHLVLGVICWGIYPNLLTFSGVLPSLATNGVTLGVLLMLVGVSIRCRLWPLGPRGKVNDLGTKLMLSMLMDAFAPGATRLFLTIIQGQSAGAKVIVVGCWFIFVSAVKFAFHGLAAAALPEAWLMRAFFPVQFIGVWVGVLLFSKIDPMSTEFLSFAAFIAIVRTGRDAVELREKLLQWLGRADDVQTVRDRIITNVFTAFQQTTTEFASVLAMIVFLVVEMLQTRSFGATNIILQQGHGLTSASYGILAALQLASLIFSMRLNVRLLKRHGLEDLLSQGLTTATLMWYSSCELTVLHRCLWVLQVNRLYTLRLEECGEVLS